MEVDFEFQKERKIGDFVQSFIDLFKSIYKHFVTTIFGLSALPLGGIALVYYFLSTKITFSANSNSFEDIDGLTWAGLLILALIALGLYVYGISIEYFILLKERKDTQFSGQEVLRNFRLNIGRYFRFLFAMILALVVIFIPVVFVAAIAIFIPFIGSFAIGILMSMVGIWLFCSFLFYREGYSDLGSCFTDAYVMLSKKLVQYGVATYIVNFIFQMAVMMISIVPMIIISLLSYNFLGVEAAFFDSSWGKLLMTLGGLFVTLFTLFLYMAGVLANGIIYETAKDLKFGERIYAMIDQIGGRDE
ncbi:ABC transporter permease [Sphingobacterium sp. InxBP1]|uniref:ABC transporter permease n=1 Tax=Sphingobacterium sp. InxBP1 TaxID=2870328 RepID=UPI002243F7D4|nr:ABC transporter permease [Sphingobacterium sp. InxBP1]MCW8312628.1 ABC transporter permease [Sphingobacterium sp. InxBP1]